MRQPTNEERHCELGFGPQLDGLVARDGHTDTPSPRYSRNGIIVLGVTVLL